MRRRRVAAATPPQRRATARDAASDTAPRRRRDASSLAQVPLANVPCLQPWLAAEATTGGVVAADGTLRPRLAADEDPVTLGIVEAADVGGVARLLAEAFASVEVDADGGTWEDAALRGIATAARGYDAAEYSVGLRARCGPRLGRPGAVEDASDPGAVVLVAARPSGGECVGAVELRLRRADGAHPTPLPVLDRVRPSGDRPSTVCRLSPRGVAATRQPSTQASATSWRAAAAPARRRGPTCPTSASRGRRGGEASRRR